MTPTFRENFIEDVFTLKRWREMLALNSGRGSLVDFHARHKLLIRAHSPEHLRRLGALVGQAATLPVPELYARYQQLLLEALARDEYVTRFEIAPPSIEDIFIDKVGTIATAERTLATAAAEAAR